MEAFRNKGWEYSPESTDLAEVILGEGIRGYVFDMVEILNHSLKAIPVLVGKVADTVNSLKEKKVDLIVLTNRDNYDVYVRGEYKGSLLSVPTPADVRKLARAEKETV